MELLLKTGWPLVTDTSNGWGSAGTTGDRGVKGLYFVRNPRID